MTGGSVIDGDAGVRIFGSMASQEQFGAAVHACASRLTQGVFGRPWTKAECAGLVAQIGSEVRYHALQRGFDISAAAAALEVVLAFVHVDGVPLIVAREWDGEDWPGLVALYGGGRA